MGEVSLRDFFAAAALTGLLAKYGQRAKDKMLDDPDDRESFDGWTFQEFVAFEAFAYADAMLDLRKERPLTAALSQNIDATASTASNPPSPTNGLNRSQT